MNKLPKKIKVGVLRNKKTGVFIAELPDYDIFTESDSFSGLVFAVNDLVNTFFGVPRKLWGKVWFMPPKEEKDINFSTRINPLFFNALVSENSRVNFK